MKHYLKVLQNYANFSGRANREEYWMFVLFNLIFSFAAMALDALLGFPVLTLLYTLGIIIPSIAVAVRRLHDTNKSGAYILIGFIPLIGGIWLLVLMIMEGDRGENDYGPDPNGYVDEFA